MKLLLRLLLAGIIGGFILGILLQGIESFTGKRVYRLLLSVDYIPVLSDWSMTETHEFLLHLTVSVFIVFGLYFVLRRTRASITLFVLGTVIIGGCYYPLTVLSGGTPDVTDVKALFYWLFAHAIYGCAAGIMIFWKKDRRIR